MNHDSVNKFLFFTLIRESFRLKVLFQHNNLQFVSLTLKNGGLHLFVDIGFLFFLFFLDFDFFTLTSLAFMVLDLALLKGLFDFEFLLGLFLLPLALFVLGEVALGLGLPLGDFDFLLDSFLDEINNIFDLVEALGVGHEQVFSFLHCGLVQSVCLQMCIEFL